MFREMTPVALWRDGLCFWIRMAQMQTDFALQMWKAMGLRAPASPDPDVETLCAAAAKPADVPDPVARPKRKAAAGPGAPAA